MEFVKEYPTMIAGKYPLRLYCDQIHHKEGETDTFLWYFGFPELILPEQLRSFLGTSLYWNNKFTQKDGDFFLDYTHYITEAKNLTEKDFVFLTKHLDFRMSSYNNCLITLKRMVDSNKKSP